MAGQAQLIFLLVIVALGCGDAAPFAFGEKSVNDEKVIYVAKLDKAFDALLPNIRNAILKNGLDPMDLIDLSESLLPFMPGLLKGKIDLKNGWLQDLSQIKRNQHVIATYTDKRLVLDMDLGFDLMDFSYEYHLEYLLAKREGDLNVRFYNPRVKVVLTIDMANFHVKMDSITFFDVRKYHVKFEGHLLDHILNLATKAVTTIFQDRVMKHIEERALKVFNAKLDEWNKNFPLEFRTDMIEEWIYDDAFDVEFY